MGGSQQSHYCRRVYVYSDAWHRHDFHNLYVAHTNIFKGPLHSQILDYLPVYFQATLGASPIGSGVDGLPTALIIAPCALFAGVTVHVMKKYRPVILTGWILTIVGFGLLSLLRANNSVAQWVGYQIVAAVGVGMLVSDPTVLFGMALTDPQWIVLYDHFPSSRAIACGAYGIGDCILGLSSSVRPDLGHHDLVHHSSKRAEEEIACRLCQPIPARSRDSLCRDTGDS